MIRREAREQSLIAFLRIFAIPLVAMAIPVMAEADCTGEVRDTTEAEREAYDWVDFELPKLFGASDDYVYKKNKKGTSRNSRCVDEPGDPYYLSSDIKFMLHGKAFEAHQADMKQLAGEYDAMGKRMQEMQKSGMDIMTIMAELESDQIRIERKNKALRARGEIKISSYFNSSSANCRGTAIEIPGAVAACRLMGDDEREHIHVLFGAWQKSEEGQWSYEGKHDTSLPTHTIQTVEISMSGTHEALQSVIGRSDWTAITARVAK